MYRLSPTKIVRVGSMLYSDLTVSSMGACGLSITIGLRFVEAINGVTREPAPTSCGQRLLASS